MKNYRLLTAVVLIGTLLLGFATTSDAATHATYALGKATTCRANYHKTTKVHTVRGKRTRYVACAYKAPIVTTTAIAPTTTTTKPGDPPTNVSIAASETPAIVGDDTTYTMTVADVLTATQAGVYMTDNGATIANCAGPTPTSEGSLVYTCDETYGDGDVGDHLIAGIFLGDDTYGQSAGQIDEPVQEPSLTLTPPPADDVTTTTTQPPAPIALVTLQEGNASAGDGYYVGFSVTASGNYATPTGNETVTVNGQLPQSCAASSAMGVCVVEPGVTEDPSTSVDAAVDLDFVAPGTYDVTASYSGDSTYPATPSQTITVSIP